jgi:hypothetical protein
MSPRALVRCYAALWLATLLGAALALVGLRVLSAGVPHDALAARTSTALALLAHNAPVALWPLALTVLGWHALPLVRTAGDVLITGQLVAHGLIVGSALGQHPAVWRYLPHLPLEWLALALPAGAWLTARTLPPGGPTAPRYVGLALIAASCLAALAGAALMETYLVPVT